MSKANAFLNWLPADADWKSKFRVFANAADPAFADAVSLASARLDFVQTNALAEISKRHWPGIPQGLQTKPIRLAILASSTVDHLVPAIFVAALRRGLWVETYLTDYGQYLQDLLDPRSGLHAFRPTVVLFALDAPHLTGGLDAAMDVAQGQSAYEAACEKLSHCWRLARDAFRCPVLQQTIMSDEPTLIGGNEHRLPGSRAAMAARLNAWLRPAADAAGVDLLALDARAARDGIAVWHDPGLWVRSKQEVKPTAAPMYGDMVARLLAAQQGLSRKGLVLDLDNTLWGGVIGDDGLQGIVLGQGSPLGEAFSAVQAYARDLSRRGVILAVCSKNDEANALEAFDKHPEMGLRRSDIACFVANWNDKASNIKAIAKALNIGLDALVFLDDNPFERALVRQELPMVAVPEVGEDPIYFPRILADAGYFDVIGITEEDRERTKLYQENRSREALKDSATDLEGYLKNLDMALIWRPFDAIGLQRTTQLINKTNQFNLTTRRYTEDEVQAVIDDPGAFGLQLRLVDRFGDNGIIAIVIGRLHDDGAVLIDTWLMSCRVLGRQVEPATLNIVAEQAKKIGATRLLGEYRPSAKNGMVRHHFEGLGFAAEDGGADGIRFSSLDLARFTPIPTFITVREG